MEKTKEAQESFNSDAKSKQAQKKPKVEHPKVETRRDKQEIPIVATSRCENTNSGIGFFTFFWNFFLVSCKNASCFWTDFTALRLLCKFWLFCGEKVFSGLVLGRASVSVTDQGTVCVREKAKEKRNRRIVCVCVWPRHHNAKREGQGENGKGETPQKPSPFPGEISISPLGDFGTCWGKKRLCTEPLPVNSTGAVTVQRPTHE